MTRKDDWTKHERYLSAYLTERMEFLDISSTSAGARVRRNTLKNALRQNTKPRASTIGKIIKALDGELENGDPDISRFDAFIDEREAEKTAEEGAETLDNTDDGPTDLASEPENGEAVTNHDTKDTFEESADGDNSAPFEPFP
ncbi:MAG: hypothetical protein AAF511_02400, partial [Pseudomonadota bacterium]